MKRIMFFATFVVALIMISCNDDDEPQPQNGDIGKFLIETTLLNPDGSSGSSYLQLIPELSGEIDNSNAIQLDFSSPIAVIDNDVFIFPTFGTAAVNEIRKYTYKTDGTLSSPETLPVTAYSTPTNITRINNEKAYVPMYGIGRVLILNPATMEKTGEIDLSTYAHEDVSAEPACGLVREELYYLPLNQADANYMPYENHRQVDVAVIDINTDEVLKVISETTSQMSFPTRPMLKNMIFTNEQNDLYIACAGYFGYNPAYRENGFVCIPSGKTEFDDSKSWDISNTTIEGTSYQPVSVFNCKYIGDGKLAAYVGIAELANNNPYTARNSMPVLIDLNVKTIKPIEGIPVSNGHGIFIDSYNNLVMFGSDGENEVGFFTYNPATEEVIHVLATEGAPYFIHSFE
ncbi:hypothetical protein [uncultured Sunxiuqinia sp.]|uniref:hypothetical protein n=1 Tax=uncultured Sunxiuqinia sp. TaxID=1573825 RepID=UPI002AA790A3|nr:hypothetical protein [uncultured Sunxiuqinia sp.]